MLVSDYMTTNLLTLTPEHRVYHALELMEQNDIRHLPIVDAGSNRLLGIVSDRDIKRHLNHSFDTDNEVLNDRLVMLTPLEEIMPTGLLTTAASEDLLNVLKTFLQHKISAIPVVKGSQDELVGLLTTHDLLELFMELLSQQPED